MAEVHDEAGGLAHGVQAEHRLVRQEQAVQVEALKQQLRQPLPVRLLAQSKIKALLHPVIPHGVKKRLHLDTCGRPKVKHTRQRLACHEGTHVLDFLALPAW